MGKNKKKNRPAQPGAAANTATSDGTPDDVKDVEVEEEEEVEATAEDIGDESEAVAEEAAPAAEAATTAPAAASEPEPAAPEPAAEPEGAAAEPAPEPVKEPAPAPAAEPEPEPAVEPELQPAAAPEPEPEPAAAPAKPESAPESAPEPTAESSGTPVKAPRPEADNVTPTPVTPAEVPPVVAKAEPVPSPAAEEVVDGSKATIPDNITKQRTGAFVGNGSAPAPVPSPVKASPVKLDNGFIAENKMFTEFKYTPLKDFIPYEELKGMRLESGIDMTRREDYLSEEEFATVFGISRDEFKGHPVWRQGLLKKKFNLF